MKTFGPVDLSNPQWGSRNLRSYLLKIFDTFIENNKKYFMDFDLQACAIIGDLIERRLCQNSKNHDAVLYNQSLVYKVFPYFFQYAIDNKIPLDNAMRVLSRKNNITIPQDAPWLAKAEWLRFFSDFHRSRFCNLFYTLSTNAALSKCTLLKPLKYPIPLFIPGEDTNAPYSAPILLLDSIPIAENLTENYRTRCYDFFRKEQISLWNELFENIKEPPFGGWQETRNKYNTLKDIIKSIYLKIPPNLLWGSWCGGYDMLSHSDWEPLRERRVYHVVLGIPDWKLAADRFMKLFSVISAYTTDVKLAFMPERIDPEVEENNPFELDTAQVVLEKSVGQGLSIPQNLEGYLSDYYRHKPSAEHFFIHPILRKNSFVVISGTEGSGKSFLAMGLGMAIASKGKLFNDWRVEKSTKVCYIADDEMSDDIITERMTVFKRMYHTDGKNFIMKTLRRKNLLIEQDRLEVEALIDECISTGDTGEPARVLILDHLNKFTGAEGDRRENWPTIREWIETLNRSRKITVILIHH